MLILGGHCEKLPREHQVGPMGLQLVAAHTRNPTVSQMRGLREASKQLLLKPAAQRGRLSR